MQPFISACLIVKNEEDMLRRCLESLQGHVDEIVIADTGSTDKTKEIAREFTDQVYEFAWTANFAEARNFVASKANGEWILMMDADECIDTESFPLAKEELKRNTTQYDSYVVDILSFVGEEGASLTKSRMARIYKNDGTLYYEGAIHEQLKKRDGKLQMAVSSLVLYHYGYLQKVVEKKGKKQRNMEIVKKDLEKSGNKGFSYFNYGQELRRLGKEEEALDAFIQAYKHKKEVNDDWVRFCLGYINELLLSLKRYEQALSILADTEKVWPTTADFVYWRGEVYYKQKRYDDAKEVFLNIVHNLDRYSDVVYLYESRGFYPHARLGEIYEVEKNDQKALHHYTEAYNHNPSAVHIIVKILKLISKYHTAEEAFEFAHKNTFFRSDKQCLEGIKALLNQGLGALSVLLAEQYFTENEIARKVVMLKASMMQTEKNQGVPHFTKEQLLYGLQLGVFDFVDLCLLYAVTKDEVVQEIIEGTKFSYIFTFLFGEKKGAKKMKGAEYIALLEKALIFGQAEFAEMLIGRKDEFHRDIHAKIADVFYANGYEEIAIEFYQMADEHHVSKQGYVNIIEWLLAHGDKEEAKRFALEGMQRFDKDFRFYRYGIELSDTEEAEQLIMKILPLYPTSNWLRRKLIEII